MNLSLHMKWHRRNTLFRVIGFFHALLHWREKPFTPHTRGLTLSLLTTRRDSAEEVQCELLRSGLRATLLGRLLRAKGLIGIKDKINKGS